LQKLNWHPTIDKKVQRYALEQKILQERKAIEQLKSENARLAELNSKLDAIVFSSATNSTPMQQTSSESGM
jgi:hypothetical protein